jgi:hypothetical protein
MMVDAYGTFHRRSAALLCRIMPSRKYTFPKFHELYDATLKLEDDLSMWDRCTFHTTLASETRQAVSVNLESAILMKGYLPLFPLHGGNIYIPASCIMPFCIASSDLPADVVVAFLLPACISQGVGSIRGSHLM